MCAPPPRRNASAPAASTTTWTMSATPRATTPSLKCWGISALVTTSRSSPSRLHGSWCPRTTACPRTGCWLPSIRKTMRRQNSGARLPDCRSTKSSASRPPTISGAWAIPAPAVRAARSSTTMAPRFPAGRPAVRTRTATGSSRSGTWCSCSSRKVRPAPACRCRARRSTPAWGWSASPPSCKASTTTTTSTFFVRSSWPAPKPPVRSPTGRSAPAIAWWRTICAAPLS